MLGSKCTVSPRSPNGALCHPLHTLGYISISASKDFTNPCRTKIGWRMKISKAPDWRNAEDIMKIPCMKSGNWNWFI